MMIYIAEDQPGLGSLMEQIFLRELACQTRSFTDGLSCYAEVCTAPPDVLVLDIILPYLSGLAVCRLLRFQEEFRHLPMLIMSSVTESDIRQKALNVGADYFLPKPLDVPLVVQTLATMLSKGGEAV